MIKKIVTKCKKQNKLRNRQIKEKTKEEKK